MRPFVAGLLGRQSVDGLSAAHVNDKVSPILKSIRKGRASSRTILNFGMESRTNLISTTTAKDVATVYICTGANLWFLIGDGSPFALHAWQWPRCASVPIYELPAGTSPGSSRCSLRTWPIRRRDVRVRYDSLAGEPQPDRRHGLLRILDLARAGAGPESTSGWSSAMLHTFRGQVQNPK